MAIFCPQGRGATEWWGIGENDVFRAIEDFQVYEKHPEHRKLVRKIGPKMVGGLTMDFEPL